MFSLRNIIRFLRSERFPALTGFFGKCKFEKKSKSKRNCTSKNESHRSFTDHFEANLVRYSELWLGKHRRVMKANSLSVFECTGLELQSRLLFYSVSRNQFSKMRLNSPFFASCWEFMKSCLIFKLFQISQIELFPTSSFSIFTFQLHVTQKVHEFYNDQTCLRSPLFLNCSLMNILKVLKEIDSKQVLDTQNNRNYFEYFKTRSNT